MGKKPILKNVVSDNPKLKYENKLTIVSITASVILGISSLAVSIWAAKNSERNVASRVDFGKLTTGRNVTGQEEWRPYIERISNKTIYVGLRRRVTFNVKFLSVPTAQASFSLINVRSGLDMAHTLGISSFTGDEKKRLDQLHVFCWTGWDTKKEKCMISMGVGLPANVAETLIQKLHDYQPTKAERQFLTESDNPGVLTGGFSDNDRWMLGFSHYVGNLEANWIAFEDVK